MKSLQCLRGQQARFLTCIPHGSSVRSQLHVCRLDTRSRCTYVAGSRPRRATLYRPISTTARVLGEKKPYELETEAELYDYTQGRLARLAAFQQGEDAILGDMHPRLEHRSETMSVADFLAANEDVEVHDPNSDAVTLYGTFVVEGWVINLACIKADYWRVSRTNKIYTPSWIFLDLH